MMRTRLFRAGWLRTWGKWLGVACLSFLVLCLPQFAKAGTFVVFGPQRYVRTTGAPVVTASSFHALNTSLVYTLEINDSTVSSAVVTLNGERIFEPQDFNPSVSTLRKEVRLREDNLLEVELRGKPGEGFTLRIIGFDQVPPDIVATVLPQANLFGWHNSDVTITFSCSDGISGIDSCTGPVTLSSEGAHQTVTGTAQDKAGNTAATSVTLNLDRTAPLLAVTHPADGDTIYAPSVEISGTASDALSGLDRITCNGLEARVEDGRFTCTVELTAGPNTLSLRGSDVAGNTATTTLTLTRVPAPTVHITEPENLSFVNTSPVTVRGTVSDPEATVKVNGITTPNAGGTFAVSVPLVEGNNTLMAVATNTMGVAGTASVQMTLDTTAPRVTILSPPEGFVTAEPAVDVSGSINDIVVGTVNDQQAQVLVNGSPADVANRSFIASAIPLALGENVIQATGRDRVGNSFTAHVRVRRVSATGAILRLVSGNNQSGPTAQQLPEPLEVRLTRADGTPAAGQNVIFKVIQNDGSLGGGSQSGRSSVAVMTDGQGRAMAWWTLGTRSGAGNNQVEATATGFAGSALFLASGETSVPGSILADSGHGQTGAVGQPLAFPFVTVVTDDNHNRLGHVPVTFKVLEGGGHLGGQTEVTVATDSDGRALAVLSLGSEPGNDNNVVEARIAGSDARPVVFMASARQPGNASDTRITGVVLDNGNNPLQGVTIRLYQAYQGNFSNIPQSISTPVATDAQGQFVIHPAPVGAFKLIADGTTVPPGNAYPVVEYDVVTVAGQETTVGLPIYLPELDRVNRLCVNPTTGGTLTLPNAPGFSLTVAPGSATFPGGSRTGCITVTPVHGDKVPMVPGFGQQPRFVVTIQPVGTAFNPPAAITMPNVDGLAPRQVTEMYSYDHDLSAFVAIGTGTVSHDGAVIRSDPGVGVLKAGWHCGGNPNSSGAAATCAECKKCQNGQCAADAAKEGATCERDECKECKGGTCTNKTAPASPFPANTANLQRVSPTVAFPRPTVWGMVWEESIDATISARCDGGKWSAVLTGLTGNYSLQVRLVNVPNTSYSEVSGTNATNFCHQVTDLNCYTASCPASPPGRPRWFMLSAVEAHEREHLSHFQPALVTVALIIEQSLEGLSVPTAPGKTQAQAIAEIQALPAYAAALSAARDQWAQEVTRLIANDHGPGGVIDTANGPAYAAERRVFGPVITSICGTARTNGWPACPVCPP